MSDSEFGDTKVASVLLAVEASVDVVITAPLTSITVVPDKKSIEETNMPTSIWAASETELAVILLLPTVKVKVSNNGKSPQFQRLISLNIDGIDVGQELISLQVNEKKEVLQHMELNLGMSVPDWPPENIDELAKKYEDPFNK